MNFAIALAILQAIRAILTSQYYDKDPADDNRFPYFALLLPDDSYKSACGGALISLNFVLTSYECVRSKNAWVDGTVYFGLRNMSFQDYVAKHDFEYASVIRFSSGCASGLMSIVRINPSIKLTDDIKLIRITNSKMSPTGQDYYSIGFGDKQDTYDQEKRSDLVMKLKFRSEDKEQCGSVINDFYENFDLTKDTICVMKDDKSEYCHNDLGSPLVSFDRLKGRLQLMGISTWFPEECPYDSKISLLYTDVYTYRDTLNYYTIFDNKH